MRQHDGAWEGQVRVDVAGRIFTALSGRFSVAKRSRTPVLHARSGLWEAERIHLSVCDYVQGALPPDYCVIRRPYVERTK